MEMKAPDYYKILEPNFTEADKGIFLKSFGNAYKELNPEVLGLKTSIDVFLKKAFSDEQAYLLANAGNIFVIKVQVDRVLVGFAIFEKTGASIYMRQICVLPEYGRRGLGLGLILRAFDIEGVESLWLVTRCHNQVSVNFYRKHGFQQAKGNEQLKGYDPNYYVKFEMHWANCLKFRLESLQLGNEICLTEYGHVSQIHHEDTDEQSFIVFTDYDAAFEYLVMRLRYLYICHNEFGPVLRKQ